MFIPTKKDRFEIKIKDVVFTVRPLTQSEVLAMSSHQEAGETQIVQGLRIIKLYIKNCLKGLSGIKTIDGKDYELEFEGDKLTEDCVEEILALDESNYLTSEICFLTPQTAMGFSNEKSKKDEFIEVSYKGKSPKKS